MADRTFDIGNGETAFLSYLNDNNETISGYFEIMDYNQAFVRIRTKGNIILIPMSRVLKIKFKGDNG